MLNINLENPHNALEDAKASQKIFEYLNYNNDIGSCETFKFENLDSKLETNINILFGIINKLEEILEDNIITEYEKIELEKMVTSIDESKIYSESTLSLQILNGILDGIVCNQKEIENLNIWLK